MIPLSLTGVEYRQNITVPDDFDFEKVVASGEIKLSEETSAAIFAKEHYSTAAEKLVGGKTYEAILRGITKASPKAISEFVKEQGEFQASAPGLILFVQKAVPNVEVDSIVSIDEFSNLPMFGIGSIAPFWWRPGGAGTDEESPYIKGNVGLYTAPRRADLEEKMNVANYPGDETMYFLTFKEL